MDVRKRQRPVTSRWA
uniref:Uncharacterized protein n=1 Tax=Moniliophthora roreri TaxID=221103 RepID=A0A0W0GB28_MONRR